MAKAAPLSKAATAALNLFHEGRAYHDDFVARVDKRYKSFEGRLDVTDSAAEWQSQLHPPYVNHIVETTLAGLVDQRFSYRVRPADRFYDPGEYEMVAQGAKAHERLHRCQLKQDSFNDLMRPFALQNSIAGLSITKTYWVTRKVSKARLELQYDEASGAPRMVPTERKPTVVYDGPTTELVDVRDFFWHEAAPSLDRARWVAHRVWLSKEECSQQEKAGRFKNTALLSAKQTGAEEPNDRDSDYRDRTKDMVEVLEIWYQTDDGIRTVTLGNRSVELVSDRENPFWHGQYPFTACSTQPGLFVVEGVSQVEKIAHLQNALWSLTNQTIDNVHLINNMIYAIRSDVQDPDAFPFEPGARWMVDDPSQVTSFAPNVAIGEVALPHMTRLEQQMQNLAGSQPFTTTSEGTLNASTATQAALVTDLASRSIQAQKNQLYLAYGKIGQLRTELNQQFVRVPVVVSELGIDNRQEFSTILPPMLQGDYLFDVEPMAESQMRAERRAEAQGKLQMILTAVPVLAQLAQAGAAKFPNVDRYVQDWLEANDVSNPESYFANATPPAPGPPQPGAGPAGPEGPGGVTAPQSIDPAVSPSNQASISPEVFMQRAGASQGGAINGPAFNRTG